MRASSIPIVSATLLLAALSACGGESDTDGAGGASSGTGTTSSGSGGAGGSLEPGEVPASKEELFVFLQAGGYLDFPKESAIHASTGPHFGTVLTFLNPTLEASLAAGNAEHPIGSAAVKELYKNGPDVGGWAVMVKTQATSDGGQGWYWYETVKVTESDPGYAGQGIPLCFNCHASGIDFVRSPYPLQ